MIGLVLSDPELKGLKALEDGDGSTGDQAYELDLEPDEGSSEPLVLVLVVGMN